MNRPGRMSENDMLIELRRLRRELAPIREAEAARRSRRPAAGRPHSAPVPMRTIHARAGALLILAIGAAVLLCGWLVAGFLAGAARSLVDGLRPDPVRVTVDALLALVF